MENVDVSQRLVRHFVGMSRNRRDVFLPGVMDWKSNPGIKEIGR